MLGLAEILILVLTVVVIVGIVRLVRGTGKKES